MDFSPAMGTLIGNIVIAVVIIVLVKILGYFKKSITKYIKYLTSLTVGLLLANVFIGFLPEILAIEGVDFREMGMYILFGLLFFYVTELVFHWHHCKDLEHNNHGCTSSHSHEHENNILMFIGTVLHNIFHGFILFGSFSISIEFGMITTLALLLHAIPQNIANYIMNHNSAKYSYLAALGGIIGAGMTFLMSDFLLDHQTLILAFISGGLLYTALTDILPEVQEDSGVTDKIKYLVFIIIGIGLFIGFNGLIGHDHAGHTEHIEESNHDGHDHH
ncbi:MAG: ZIP family metal transporter [Candidatus Gracilibacteria bacterium]|nr:ZIP family metal transporter [Candidatus Gracilibacteria bacterium]